MLVHEGKKADSFHRNALTEVDKVVRRASVLAASARPNANYATQLNALAQHLLQARDGEIAQQLFSVAFANLLPVHLPEGLADTPVPPTIHVSQTSGRNRLWLNCIYARSAAAILSNPATTQEELRAVAAGLDPLLLSEQIEQLQHAVWRCASMPVVPSVQLTRFSVEVESFTTCLSTEEAHSLTTDFAPGVALFVLLPPFLNWQRSRAKYHHTSSRQAPPTCGTH